MSCTLRRSRWLSYGVLALIACHSEPANKPSVGSDTNWLRACMEDSDCGGSQCRCGVCTLSCDALDACGEIPEAQLCIEVGELSATSCRVGFADPTQQGICSQACGDDLDCGNEGGRAAYCIDGVCLPASGLTPNGSVLQLAGTREPDAGAIADSGAIAVPDADVSDAASVQDAAPLDAGGLIGSPLVTVGGMQIEFPVPQPKCPCVSDLPAGAAAPAPGDAEPNSYGNPSPAVEPSDSPLSGGISYLQCALPAPVWWFNVDSECIRYANCMVPCGTDADCPSGGTGSATPRCSMTGVCFLDCRGERTCPDGMACVTGADGAACFWPQDVLAPGCDAYCRQHPPPRDCDNWCAEAFVACDPDAGVNCCQGLSCTEGGFCDEVP